MAALLLLLGSAAVLIASGSAVPAPQAGLSRGQTLIENDRVLVVEGTIGPGEVTGMHTHQLPAVIICLEGATLKETLPDGKTKIVERKAGDVLWRDREFRHDEANTGDTRLRVIAVQLKK